MTAPDDELQDRPPGRMRQRVLQGLIATGLLVVGLAAGFLWSERRARPPMSGVPSSSPRSAPMDRGAPGAASSATVVSEDPIEVTLTSDAVERAGIKTAVVRREAVAGTLTVPGTVTSNAYRDTKVNALVGGVIRQVSVELGATVRRGQPLAVIVSSELADAQMRYLSMRAMLEADHQKLQRTAKLTDLGAASRQELEEVTATHASRATELAAARQRLLLLGLAPAAVERLTDASHVVSEVTVAAPADGVVIARSINPGQVVTSSQELFAVTDLGTVWVIGDLYEKDFGAVRAGTGATIGVPAIPDRTVRGRVAYIDPRVDPASRTAKVRIEVPNRGGDLRLGMFVNVGFETAGGQRVVVPRAAVQVLGERTVVYLSKPDAEGQYVERRVKVGDGVGPSVEILDGVKPGDRVVTEGSFFLRSEAGRTRGAGS